MKTFKKEYNACVWSDLHEPEEFEEIWQGIIDDYGLEDVDWLRTLYAYKEYWIPAYFRDFPLGSMIRTTSVSESENSFYKNFLKPSSNLAEFYLSFNNALECQRNSTAKLDYADSTNVPILGTDLPFEKHAATLYTDSIFRTVQEEIVEGCGKCRIVGFSSEVTKDLYKVGDTYRNTYLVTHDKSEETYACECKLFGRKGYLCSHIFYVFKNNGLKVIPDKYSESRWMKTPLVKDVHGFVPENLQNIADTDEKSNIIRELTSMFYDCLSRYQSSMDSLRNFMVGFKDLRESIDSDLPPTSALGKRKMVEEFYGMARPEVVEVHPPKVVRTKGSCSDVASRLISQREKAIKESKRALRKCRYCGEMCHHDARTCHVKKEDEANAKK